MLHKETIEAETLDLIYRLVADENLKRFNLVGGTALALMIGHRISVDIDLFTDTEFDAEKLASILSAKYRVNNLEVEKNTINCFIEDIKVDCIAHCYPWLQPPNEIEGIRFASLEDIAAMKFNAIVQDGSRVKDYMDMYVMLEKKSLSELLSCYENKYPNVSWKTASKALLYHDEVKQTQHLELMRKDVSWSNVVKRLRQANIDPSKIFKPESGLMQKNTQKQSRGRRI